MNKDIENRLKEYGEFEKNIDNIVVVETHALGHTNP